MKVALLTFILSLPLLASALLRPRNNFISVGQGNRFDGNPPLNDGVTPRGLGTQPPNTQITTLLNFEELTDGFSALDKEYGDVFQSFYSNPRRTEEDRWIVAGQVGGHTKPPLCDTTIRILLTAGIAGHDRGGPDGLLYFISDLLYANKHQVGLQYGEKSYTYDEVKTVISAGIAVIPLINPDGYVYDQRTDSCWRKNRSKRGSPEHLGVNLNRNFDFLRGLTSKSSVARMVLGQLASNQPSSDEYEGDSGRGWPPSGWKEAEASSVQWIMNGFPNIRWFANLHSSSGSVLINWAHAPNQIDNPDMNFMNFTRDLRAIDFLETYRDYGEYIPPAYAIENGKVAAGVSAAMTAVAGRQYVPAQANEMEKASGTITDWAYSRHMLDPTKNLIRAFEIGFGFGNMEAPCEHYPTVEQHNLNMLELGAAFMELGLEAVRVGLGKEPVPPFHCD